MSKKRKVSNDEIRRRSAKNARRTKRKKKNRILTVFILIAFAVAVFVVLSKTVLFRIHDIVVEGNERYLAEEITSLIDIHEEDSLVGMQTQPSEERVEMMLPYIDEVTISPRYPNTLLVSVKEAGPSFKAATDSGTILLNAKSKVLEWTDAPNAYDVPLLIGFDTSQVEIGHLLSDNESNAAKLKTVADILNYANEFGYVDEFGILGIKKIDIIDEYNIILDYESRIRIFLGNASELENKLVMTMGVIQKLSPSSMGSIDIRTTNTAFYNPAGY